MVETDVTRNSIIPSQKPDMTLTERSLKEWLGKVLSVQAVAKTRRLELTSISGDAGFRHYWRLNTSPSMVAVFSPPETEVVKAKKILEELEKAAKEGKGAAQLDGRMIDAASARMAENVVNINKLIQGK